MTKYYYRIITLAVLMLFVSGCATTTYFKIDPSLTKEARTFDGVQYLPLVKICDTYGLDCRWDTFANTATIQRKSNRILLRAGSSTMLVNGTQKKMDRPVVVSSNIVFVPVSFVKNDLGPMIGARPAAKAVERETAKRVTIRRIVLDPGHGGKDAGAMGKRAHLREKDMVLLLSKKIKDILEGEGIEVVMTRDDDTFIPLPRRTDIANRSGADLFVSIHMNASRSRAMRGFECYFLSNATDDNARALEAFEDSSLRMNKEASLEHSKQLDKTLWDMALTENRRESSELAGYICSSIEESFAMRNRGIRSARFYVLKHTQMPSILVEAGYISNRYEEMKLRDPLFLDKIASAVAQGILKYKKEYERTEGFTT